MLLTGFLYGQECPSISDIESFQYPEDAEAMCCGLDNLLAVPFDLPRLSEYDQGRLSSLDACGIVLNNPVWFRFVADSEEVNFSVVAFACDSPLEYAIFRPGDFDNPLLCERGPFNGDIVIEDFATTPGEEFLFVIDSYVNDVNNHPACRNLYFDFIDSNVGLGAIPVGDLPTDPTIEFVDVDVLRDCLMGDVTMVLPKTSGADSVSWTIRTEGQTIDSILVSGDTIVYNFQSGGLYEVSAFAHNVCECTQVVTQELRVRDSGDIQDIRLIQCRTAEFNGLTFTESFEDSLIRIDGPGDCPDLFNITTVLLDIQGELMTDSQCNDGSVDVIFVGQPTPRDLKPIYEWVIDGQRIVENEGRINISDTTQVDLTVTVAIGDSERCTLSKSIFIEPPVDQLRPECISTSLFDVVDLKWNPVNDVEAYVFKYDGQIDTIRADTISTYVKSFFDLQELDVQIEAIKNNGCSDLVQFVECPCQSRVFDLNDEIICEGQEFFGETESGPHQVQRYDEVQQCDIIWNFDLIVIPRIIESIDLSICQGQSIDGVDINGRAFLYALDGTYIDTFPALSTGCDSVRILNLSIDPIIESSMIKVSICEGDIWDNKYSTGGNYEDLFQTEQGCDSIRHVELTIRQHMETDLGIIDICQGENYLGFSTSGSFQIDSTTMYGCDSIILFDLNVIEPIVNQGFVFGTICAGEELEGHSTSGLYMDTFVAQSTGCDSVRSLVLTVLPVADTIIYEDICLNTDYEGYTTEGTYVDVFEAANGCDSTRTIVLTTFDRLEQTVEASICVGDSYEGYTEPGTYEDSFISSEGCDSLRTLILTYFGGASITIESPSSICLFESTPPLSIDYSLFGDDGTGVLIWQSEFISDDGLIDPASIGPGTYTIVAEYQQNGCSYIGQQTIDIFSPPSVQIDFSSPECTGQEEGVLLLTGQGGSGQYEFYINDEQVEDETELFYKPGQYEIYINDIVNGCTSRAFDIVLEENEFLNLVNEIEIVGNSIVESSQQERYALDLLDEYEVFWTFNEQPLCPDSECPYEIDFQTDTAGELCVDIFYNDACESLRLCQEISVLDRFRIYIPNVFKPGSTEGNDEMIIYINDDEASVKTFQIFDRGGNQVHRIEDSTTGLQTVSWDGRKGGQIMPAGVYVYYLELDTEYGPKDFHGTFTLLQ